MEYYKKKFPTRMGKKTAGQILQFMLSLDEKLLSGKQKTDFCEILISRNYIREAYGMLREISLKDFREADAEVVRPDDSESVV